MLCENCKRRPANVQIMQIESDRRIQKNLCNVCVEELAAASGLGDLGLGGFFDIPDILSNLLRRRPQDRMYDYFSDTARKVIHLAKEEAVRLSHDMIYPEHVLLGLIKEEGFAYKILEKMNINSVELFSGIESLIGRGTSKSKEIGLSPRAKRVLDLAFHVARELGFGYVGSEHILLGLIREGESIASQALEKRGITFEKTAGEILSQIQQKEVSGAETPADGKDVGEPDEEEEEGESEGSEGFFAPGMQGVFGMGPQVFGFPGAATKPKKALSTFTRDLTALAREGRLDPVIDREKEVERVIRILSRRTKNNPVLLGDPGVGKTAIVEGLAQRIVQGDVPDALLGKQVLALDLMGMVAGTKYRGEFEERIKKLVDEILKKKRQIILFIDEVHTLSGAGAAEGATDAGNILKPALAKGDLQMVGATTVDEYRKHIEKDAALERRFQPVMVDAPSPELTLEILKGIRDKYEAHHGVRIPDDALQTAVTLSDRYITDRYLPDKAIDLMDEAAAKVHLRMISPPQQLKQKRRELAQLQKDYQSAFNAKDQEKAAKLKENLSHLESDVKVQEEKWILEKGKANVAVTPHDIAEIVSEWRGIPVTELTVVETERLLAMEEHLHKHIIGQEEAVEAISQAIRRGRAGLKAPGRPIGSFVFAGPTGVGKTELARRVAEFLFGSQDMMIRLDMSEYMEKHTVSRLVGAPPGYVGFDEGGQLTEAVRRKPYSVVLFDEIEKAHPDVFNALLQILEDGRLTDAKGRAVDFKNTVIIMTTNVGVQHISDAYTVGFKTRDKQGREMEYEDIQRNVLDEMRRSFRPEFLNRIDEIIVFHPLTREDIAKIIDVMLLDVSKEVAERKMSLVVTPEAKEILIQEGYDPKFGARPLRRAIQKRIENALSNEILKGHFKEGDQIRVVAMGGKISFEKIDATADSTTKRKARTLVKK